MDASSLRDPDTGARLAIVGWRRHSVYQELLQCFAPKLELQLPGRAKFSLPACRGRPCTTAFAGIDQAAPESSDAVSSVAGSSQPRAIARTLNSRQQLRSTLPALTPMTPLQAALLHCRRALLAHNSTSPVAPRKNLGRSSCCALDPTRIELRLCSLAPSCIPHTTSTTSSQVSWFEPCTQSAYCRSEGNNPSFLPPAYSPDPSATCRSGTTRTPARSRCHRRTGSAFRNVREALVTPRSEVCWPDSWYRWPASSLGKCSRSQCRLPRSSPSTRSRTIHPEPGRCVSPRTLLWGCGEFLLDSSKSQRAHIRTHSLRNTRGCRRRRSRSLRVGGSSTSSTGGLPQHSERQPSSDRAIATHSASDTKCPDPPCPRTFSSHPTATTDSAHVKAGIPTRPVQPVPWLPCRPVAVSVWLFFSTAPTGGADPTPCMRVVNGDYE